jgi:hypothetical protein
MDWARAVEINRNALIQIVGELLVLIGSIAVQRLPHAVYAAAERLLRPTESALRRLIVIAARGLNVKLSPARPMPKGLVIAGTGNKPLAFALFDKRASFDFISPENPLILKVHTYQNNPFNLFNAIDQQHIPEPKTHVSAVQLCRRLAAVAHALKTIPAQARRLLRWKFKRKNLANPKFTSPLRPGPPPGHSAKPSKEVDFILMECHALAFDVLKEDSS